MHWKKATEWLILILNLCISSMFDWIFSFFRWSFLIWTSFLLLIHWSSSLLTARIMPSMWDCELSPTFLENNKVFEEANQHMVLSHRQSSLTEKDFCDINFDCWFLNQFHLTLSTKTMTIIENNGETPPSPADAVRWLRYINKSSSLKTILLHSQKDYSIWMGS